MDYIVENIKRVLIGFLILSVISVLIIVTRLFMPYSLIIPLIIGVLFLSYMLGCIFI